MTRLEGKVALITGAAQGIGAAIARAFVAEGAKVALIDLQADLLVALANELEGAEAFPFDITRLDSISLLVDQVEEKLGPVDILVNSAGICPTHGFDEATPAALQRVMEVNLVAPFTLLQEVAKRMKSSGRSGAIINLASISAFLPKLEQLEYGASKAALVSITRSAAASLGPYGMRVNAIAPGVIETPLTHQIAGQRAEIRGVSAEETLRPIIEATPLRRIGIPEEVADMAVFLASDVSSFITGQTFDVCGGQLMR